MGFNNASLLTVEETYRQNNFVIPEFQRGYAWGEDQCKALWDDVVNLTRQAQSNHHYCGTIMISREAQEAGKVELIDGQQRMTSISLMLAALGVGGFPIEFRKNEGLQTYFDYHAMQHAQHGASLSRHNSYYARNIAQAAGYFAERSGALTEVQRLELAQILRERFKLFVLEIQPDFDVHVAFETINNRGKPLSTLEKLKNRLIFLASKTVAAEASKATTLEVHRCWKNVYAALGAGRDLLDDDEFLRAHAMGWFRHERKAEWLSSRLFDEEFSLHSEVSGEKIVAYVRSLEQAAACWHLMHAPEKLPPQVACQLLALDKVANSSSRPLLLWALLRLSQEYPLLLQKPAADGGWALPFAQLAKQAERFAVLVVMVNNRLSNVGQSDMNRSAYALAHPGELVYSNHPEVLPPPDGRGAVEFAESLMRSIIYNGDSSQEVGENESRDSRYVNARFRWFGYFDPALIPYVFDERLRKHAGFYNWAFGKLALYAWEDFLRGEKGRPEKKMPWERFAWDDSVEHVYPQSPHKLWQESIALNGRSSQAAHNAIGNSLGNLLLLSRSRNASLSNLPYVNGKDVAGKRDRFTTGSYSEIQVAQLCQEWTVLQIAARGIAILKQAQQTWDFEVVADNEKLTAWLPLLFGDQAEKVQQGHFSFGKRIDNRTLSPWVKKFSAGLL